MPQLLGVEDFVKDKRHGHVVALHELAVFEEVEGHYAVSRHALHGGLAPKKCIHAEQTVAAAGVTMSTVEVQKSLELAGRKEK